MEKEYVKVHKEDMVRWELFRMRREEIVKVYCRIRAKQILTNRLFKKIICRRMFNKLYERFKIEKSKRIIYKHMLRFWLRYLAKKGIKHVQQLAKNKIHRAITFQGAFLSCSAEHRAARFIRHNCKGLIR